MTTTQRIRLTEAQTNELCSALQDRELRDELENLHQRTFRFRHVSLSADEVAFAQSVLEDSHDKPTWLDGL
jgi:hypothetical protein